MPFHFPTYGFKDDKFMLAHGELRSVLF